MSLPYPKYPISFTLSKPKRVFSLSADPQIAPLLEVYNYDAAAREADLAAVDGAEDKVMAQEKAIGDAQQATVTVKGAEKNARAAFGEFRTIGRRLALKGDAAALRTLGLHQSTPRKRDEFVTTAHTAYQNALDTPEILARFVNYGYHEEKLTGLIAEVETVVEAQAAREAAFGAQQLATQAQNEALLDVEERYRKFLVLVDLAITEPQLKEKLGLLEPSN